MAHPVGRVGPPCSGAVILSSNQGNIWLSSARITCPHNTASGPFPSPSITFMSFFPHCILAPPECLLRLYLIPMGAATWSHRPTSLDLFPEGKGLPALRWATGGGFVLLLSLANWLSETWYSPELFAQTARETYRDRKGLRVNGLVCWSKMQSSLWLQWGQSFTL